MKPIVLALVSILIVSGTLKAQIDTAQRINLLDEHSLPGNDSVCLNYQMLLD